MMMLGLVGIRLLAKDVFRLILAIKRAPRHHERLTNMDRSSLSCGAAMANEQSYEVSQDDLGAEHCALHASVAGRRDPTADWVWSTASSPRAEAAAACSWVINS